MVWCRAALLGGVMLLTGTVSHVAAGGLLPHPAAVALLAAGLVAVAARFVGGPASTVRVVALVVTGQAVAHTVLSALAGHHGDASPPPAAGSAELAPTPALHLPLDADGRRVGSLMDAYAGTVPSMHDAAPGVPTAPLVHLAEHVTSQSPVMLAAHVGGAVVLALWLAVGERALWSLLHLAAARVLVAAEAHRAVAALRAAVRGAAGVRHATAAATGFRPLPGRERPGLSRRGPPGLLIA